MATPQPPRQPPRQDIKCTQCGHVAIALEFAFQIACTTCGHVNTPDSQAQAQQVQQAHQAHQAQQAQQAYPSHQMTQQHVGGGAWQQPPVAARPTHNMAPAPAAARPTNNMAPAAVRPTHNMAPAAARPTHNIAPAAVRPTHNMAPAAARPIHNMAQAAARPLQSMAPAAARPAAAQNNAEWWDINNIPIDVLCTAGVTSTMAEAILRARAERPFDSGAFFFPQPALHTQPYSSASAIAIQTVHDFKIWKRSTTEGRNGHSGRRLQARQGARPREGQGLGSPVPSTVA
jgi:hypothetical protein